ncbi:hypothetical protein ONE63_010334 [Megalurothrips usitatus]|uniref:Mutator-like transposase domain-containing protein n=1 Tax=Megalurothrips usitatus TaxID=439358 RepID=A0AAV7XL82_9NEOP|nr:hypothetical protein ONE63_010334 [Megalurothrips usitatus]
MEAQNLVKGINQLYDAGLHAKYIIGDGDSNVFNKIRQCTARGRTCVKLESANHVVRGYTSRLVRILNDTSVSMEGRNLLKTVQRRLTAAARGAIHNSDRKDPDQLRQHLLNGPLPCVRRPQQLPAERLLHATREGRAEHGPARGGHGDPAGEGRPDARLQRGGQTDGERDDEPV